MHLQSSRVEGGGFQIKKPCCSPAAYRPLDILHLDQVKIIETFNIAFWVYVHTFKALGSHPSSQFFMMTSFWIGWDPPPLFGKNIQRIPFIIIIFLEFWYARDFPPPFCKFSTTKNGFWIAPLILEKYIDSIHFNLQADPSRLKVTNWRDIIVTACACSWIFFSKTTTSTKYAQGWARSEEAKSIRKRL